MTFLSNLKSWALACTLISLAGTSTATNRDADADELKLVTSLSLLHTPGSNENTESISLGSGHYLLMASQDHADLVLTLRSKEFESISVNSLTDRLGNEYLAFSLTQEGEVLVESRAVNPATDFQSADISVHRISETANEFFAVLEQLTRAGQQGLDRSNKARLEAIEQLSSAADWLQRSGHLALAGFARLQLATNYYWILSIENADAEYRRAIELFEQLAKPRMANVTRAHLAAAIMEASRHDEAQQLFESALTSLGTPSDTYEWAVANNNYGLLALYRERWQAAAQRFSDAAQVFESLDQHAKRAQAQGNLALIKDKQTDLIGARDTYKLALETLERMPDAWLQAILKTNLANVERRLGNTNEALQLLLEARSYQEKHGTKQDLAWIVNGLASVYRSVGDIDSAMSIQRESVQLRQKYEEAGGLFNALMLLGTDLNTVGRRRGDAAKFEEALDVFGLAANHAVTDGSKARLNFALAKTLCAKSDCADAENYFRQALALASSAKQDALRHEIQVAFAQVSQLKKAERKSALDEALAFFAQQPPSKSAALALFRQAGLEDDRQQAIRLNDRALAVFRELRRTIANPRLATHLAEFEQPVVEAQISLLLATDDSKSALELAIAHRGVSAAAILSELQLDENVVLSSDQAPRMRPAMERYHDARNRLLIARERGSIESIDRLEANVRLALAELDSIRAAGRTRLANFDAAGQAANSSVENIQKWLETKSTTSHAILLFYFVGQTSSQAWAVTPERIVHWPLPGENELMTMSTGVVSRIVRRSAEFTVELNRSLQNAAARILPDLDALGWPDHTYIIADGPLTLIPFPALIVHKEGRPSYLIEHTELHHAPSITALLTPTKEKEDFTNAPIVMLDNPLPGADDTGQANITQAIVPLTHSQKAPLRASTLPTQDERVRVLHIASHAWLDPSVPALSGMALHDADGTRRDITLAEIYQLRLQTDLVILAACDTYVGKIVRGEGTLSLARGFLNAGSQRVIATNWPIADRFAAPFSRALFAGLETPTGSPAAALRDAQIGMLRGFGDQRHPFYWAGYTITGIPQ